MTLLLQISDPHIVSQAGARLRDVPTAASLDDVLSVARGRFGDCARVVWSGDISHDETVEGYHLFRQRVGSWIARSLLIPGNHDNRRALRESFPQVNDSEDEPVGFIDEIDGWRLVGLDTHLPGETAGAISETQCTRITQRLAGRPAMPTMVFLHHPPISVDCRWLDSIGLRNPPLLRQLIAALGDVRGIFCGHVHQEFAGSFLGVPVYTSPSTAFQFLPRADESSFDELPPGFRVIELGDATFNTYVVRLGTLKYRPRKPTE
jgi:Icc protein